MIVWNDLTTVPVLIGGVCAEGIQPSRAPQGLDDALDALLHRRRQPLTPAEEQRRLAARDMLRNGRYKPTGRGKPASEYLVRAAASSERTFPRINGPVDVGNYISLKTVLPLSLWDHDRANASGYRFRLGHADESYAFNAGGQRIDLHDLVVGCALRAEQDLGTPIVNPVKDSMATKITPETTRVAAAIYAPRAVISPDELQSLCATMAEWLSRCGEQVTVTYDVAPPGTRVEV